MIEKIKATRSEKIILIFLLSLAIFSFGSFFLIKNKCLFVKNYDPTKITFEKYSYVKLVSESITLTPVAFFVFSSYIIS